MTAVQEELFDTQPFLVAPAPALSAQRRRTLRQHDLVARGIHPLALTYARPELGTCGDCIFRQLQHGGVRLYPKCTRYPERTSHSASTDCRAWWPACPDYEKRIT